MKKIVILLSIVLLPALVSAQQQDSAAVVLKKDSVTQHTDSVLQHQTTVLMRKMDSTRQADSLKRVELMREIENLKGRNSNKQRELLLKKLRDTEQQDSIRRANQQEQLTKLKGSAKGFPVDPFSDTLFMVYTRVGSFSAQERAEAISSKIKTLYDDYQFSPDSLALSLTETSAEIVYHDMMVMSVNELEAMWYDKKPKEVAMEYRSIIQQTIKQRREDNSVLNISLRVGAIIAAVIGIYFIIVLINRLFKRVNTKIINITSLRGLRIGGYQILDSQRTIKVFLFLTNILRLIIIVLTMYIALPLLFSVFPWTRGIANVLINWTLDPIKGLFNSLVDYLPNIFTIAVIATVTHYVVKLLEFVAGEIENGVLTIPSFYPEWAKPTFNIVKFLIYAFSFIIIFPYLPGSDSPIFQGVSVFVGILFSLGSSSAISNAVAGLVITYMRPFKIGDRIKIGDVSGDVIEKSLLVTRIRTVKNEDITMPNSSILSGHTINYTTAAKELGLILHTSVTIGYDVPWKQVHELLINAALATEGIMRDEKHKPFVLQTSLDDFYVAYQINVYTNQSNRMAAIYSELHQNIQDKFNEGGVEILSPHYRAARDGNMTTIPASYLSKEYQAPTFNVTVKNTKEEK